MIELAPDKQGVTVPGLRITQLPRISFSNTCPLLSFLLNIRSENTDLRYSTCAQCDGGVKCGEGKSGANSHEQPRKVLAMKLERRRLKGHRSPLEYKMLLFGQFFIPSAHLSHNAGQRQRPELKPLKHSNAAFEQVDFY